MGPSWGSGRARRVLGAAFGILGFAGAAAAQQVAPPEAPASVESLKGLTLEQLGEIQVTSVAKRPEALADAPAAIYVITHEDIQRSGAATLPEILRLAPNLQVYQTGSASYVITARGFDGSATDQNFSNKLLVLIDGRSVYSPMFSGVYWDMQDVAVADIDRIEVISGPGATLWGANAVNGVINIVTRKAAETQGGLVDLAGGNLDGTLTVRYGGQIGESVAWRAYFKETVGAASELQSGATANDSWSRPQGGFRLDWTPTAADSLTLEGDAFAAAEAQAGPNQDLAGRNLTARWDHDWANGQNLQVLAYYDYESRVTQDGGGAFHVDTYDLEGQDSIDLGSRNRLVVGAGARVSQYAISDATSLFFSPDRASLSLFDVFAEDRFAPTATTSVTLGLKGEDDPYSGFSLLPDLRATWKPTDQTLLWAAASRAIRSPTPFDTGVIEKIGDIVYLVGNSGFAPETLTAYQVGARAEASAGTSISISGYYNLYNDLRSIDFGTTAPLTWGNGIKGETYGVEVWGDVRVFSWWTLAPGFDAMHERFTLTPEAVAQVGVQQVANDPSFQASLKSSMNIGSRLTLDADLRYVGAMPDPHIPAYAELDARIGWKLTDRIELGVTGDNLLHARHLELAGGTYIPRSVLAELRWRF